MVSLNHYFIKGFIIKVARSLRKNQTPQETLLWRFLRDRQVAGFKFLRQHPIEFGNNEYKPEFFVADFYCAEKRLVVEIDGKIHEFQKAYDKNRDEILNELGLRVLRIKNEELEEIDKVLAKILSELTHFRVPL